MMQGGGQEIEQEVQLNKLGSLLATYCRREGVGKSDKWPNPELLSPNEVRMNKREIFQSFIGREITSREQFAWFVKTFLGFDIPSKTICSNHYSTLDVLWSFYHDRPRLALWISNRGSGKTRGMSMLNIVEMLTRDDYEINHSAAIQSQALRAYNYFRQYNRNPLIASQLSGPPTQGKTDMINGSRLETIVATWSGVNSPHVPTLRLDEVELIKDFKLLEEALYIPQSNKNYNASVVLASTRKWEAGIVQRLVDEAADRGIRVYTTCIFEVLEPCERMCLADPKYGDCYGMQLNQNTQEAYCGGKAHQSEGFYRIDDFLNLLQHNSDEGLDAQVFCRSPHSAKGPRVLGIDKNLHLVDWSYFQKMTGKVRPPVDDKNWRWLGGLDFGVVFVFSLIVLDPYDRAWVVGEYYHDANDIKTGGPRLLRDHYKGILQIPHLPMENDKPSPKIMVWPDPSGNQEILELWQLGMPIIRQKVSGRPVITLGKYNDLAMGVNELKTRLKVDPILNSARLLFVQEACPQISRESEAWCHPVDKDGKPLFDEYGDDDHGPDSIRYPLYGLRYQRRIVAKRAKGLY